MNKEIERDPKTGEELWKEIPRKKSELRKLTHLHHAIDACTLGILAQVLPKDGKLCEGELYSTRYARRIYFYIAFLSQP